MSLEDIDSEKILDVLTSHVDGDWNDGLGCYIEAESDGEFLVIKVLDGNGNSKRFSLTIED